MSKVSSEVRNWKTAFDLVYNCGLIHDIQEFLERVLDGVLEIVPTEQARCYLIDENGKVQEQFLRGIDKRKVRDYHDYYSRLENGKYSLSFYPHLKMDPYRPDTVLGIRDWSVEPKNEFTDDYVRSLGLQYSLGFVLLDTDKSARAQFMLDRTTNQRFTEREVWILSMSIPHLNNLFNNILVAAVSREREMVDFPVSNALTSREKEIMRLIYDGVGTTNVGKRLRIAPSTVNKHIAHIYAKMHVSSRQELMAKLAHRNSGDL